MYVKAILRSGIVMYGTVRSGLARLRAVGQALLKRYLGLAWSCEVGRCIARQASALIRLGLVRRGPVRFSPVGHAFHGYGVLKNHE